MGQVTGPVEIYKDIAIMEYSSYELKYCERCGGLGLRRSKTGLPYCGDCEQMMRAFLPGPAADASDRGQLQRIVHRMGQRGVPSFASGLRAEEAVHAS